MNYGIISFKKCFDSIPSQAKQKLTISTAARKP